MGHRIKQLNIHHIKKGAYVVYWMQSSVRVGYNHALVHAITVAHTYEVPLIVYFELISDFPEGNMRSYTFLLQGVQDCQCVLEKMGIRLIIRVRNKHTPYPLVQIAKDALCVVADRGYLRMQRVWQDAYAQRLLCPLVRVESNVVVPVEHVSPKEEYSAATFRRKYLPLVDAYNEKVECPDVKIPSLQNPIITSLESYDIADIPHACRALGISSSVPAVSHAQGGESKAQEALQNFIIHNLADYPTKRNNPSLDYQSGMSPYLHYGHISPLFIAQRVMEYQGYRSMREWIEQEAYGEELLIRRELAMNFVSYNSQYDRYTCLPHWAHKTLAMHTQDTRPYTYSRRQLEYAQTHDTHWNAAQRHMVAHGVMHGYMRMYWGKKIIEWSNTPEEAWDVIVYLNNTYELDGRDPNSYAGIAWCFGKHDRPWKERSIFGMVRYMSEGGLKRKRGYGSVSHIQRR